MWDHSMGCGGGTTTWGGGEGMKFFADFEKKIPTHITGEVRFHGKITSKNSILSKKFSYPHPPLWWSDDPLPHVVVPIPPPHPMGWYHHHTAPVAVPLFQIFQNFPEFSSSTQRAEPLFFFLTIGEYRGAPKIT